MSRYPLRRSYRCQLRVWSSWKHTLENIFHNYFTCLLYTSSGHIYVHYRYDCKHEARQNCRKCFTNSSTPIYLSLIHISMRTYRIGQHQTSGTNEADNTQVVSELYEVFVKENARAAGQANYQEGNALNEKYYSDGHSLSLIHI